MKSISKKASIVVVAMALTSNAFVQHSTTTSSIKGGSKFQATITVDDCSSSSSFGLPWPFDLQTDEEGSSSSSSLSNKMVSLATSVALVASLTFAPLSAVAENELSDKYGGKGFDSSLVDQTCLVDKCSIQAKACLADDPSCRKGLTCTAKCLGDNSCITGCMARYGNQQLDNLLKCTIEDHECIKIAILQGGPDKFGDEPPAPKPTIQNFDYATLEGTWYKVVGYNPNYDCYACQRNTFSIPQDDEDVYTDVTTNGGPVKFVSTNHMKKIQQPEQHHNILNMDVEFAMPHLLPDGSPPPPKQIKETMALFRDTMTMNDNSMLEVGLRSIGLNEYNTHETMVFDTVKNDDDTSNNINLVLNKGRSNEARYSRTAHSEGEMFGLKFWENWYLIGENDPDMPEFKFIYYNGKTRQNTYEGAFVYSRSRTLEPESMAKVYAIAKEAGMNPDQFCRIRNGCFSSNTNSLDPLFAIPNNNNNNMNRGTPVNGNGNEEMFRGIIASTKVSELLGVEAVSAREEGANKFSTSQQLQPLQRNPGSTRPWWYEVGDYLENPHRHFEVMDSLRKPMEWPDHIKSTWQD